MKQYISKNASVAEINKDVLLTEIEKSLKHYSTSEDLEEAAHSYVDTAIEWFDSEGNPCCYPAFIAGAQWQKKQLIDKAIKWLEDNIDRYLYNTGGYGEYIPKCGGKMFEDFKKAMEE